MRQPLEKFSQNIYFVRSYLHCYHNDVWRNNSGGYVFSPAGHKVDFIALFGSNKSIFRPSRRKKNRVRHERNIHFTLVVITLALLGHQTSHSQNNFFFPGYTIYYYNYRVALIFWLTKRILHKNSISESYTAILSTRAFGELWNASCEDEDVNFCILCKEDMPKKLNRNNSIHCDSCDPAVHLKCVSTGLNWRFRRLVRLKILIFFTWTNWKR